MFRLVLLNLARPLSFCPGTGLGLGVERSFLYHTWPQGYIFDGSQVQGLKSKSSSSRADQGVLEQQWALSNSEAGRYIALSLTTSPGLYVFSWIVGHASVTIWGCSF